MSSLLEDIATAQRISHQRAAPKRGLGEALEAERLAVIRIRWTGRTAGLNRHQLYAYSAEHQRIPLTAEQQKLYLDGLMAAYPDTTWFGDWDYHVGADRLFPCPLPEQPGYIPEHDDTFGSGPLATEAGAP